MWTDGPFQTNRGSSAVASTNEVAPMTPSEDSDDNGDPEPASSTAPSERKSGDSFGGLVHPPSQEPTIKTWINVGTPSVISIPAPPKELQIGDIGFSIFKPSDSIQMLFESINKRVNTDIRTKLRLKEKLFLGYPSEIIRSKIIERGVADFTTGYNDDITAADKTLLYCYFNAKKHLCTSYQIFESLENLSSYFSEQDKKPLIIDIGCGPATSLLALLDLIHSKSGKNVNLNYIGIDRSNTMLAEGQNLVAKSSLLHTNSDVEFATDYLAASSFIWNRISESNLIIFNTSFLFASESLDVSEMSRFIAGVHRAGVPSYFINQNPPIDALNVKFEEFKAIMNNINSNFEEIYEQDLELECLYAQNTKFDPKLAKVRLSILKRNG